MKKAITLVIFIAMVSLSSCTQDTDGATNDNFAENSAKDWFNNTFKKSKEWQQNADSPNKIPDWSNGTYLKKDSIEVFEFPMMENKSTIAIPVDKSLSSEEVNKIPENTIARLVIIKTQTNEMIVRKLYYVPDYKYLVSKNFDISQATLGKDGDDFTGLLITKNWNDEFLSYNRMKNGEISGILVKQKISVPKSDLEDHSTGKITGKMDVEQLDEVVIYGCGGTSPNFFLSDLFQPYYPIY